MALVKIGEKNLNNSPPLCLRIFNEYNKRKYIVCPYIIIKFIYINLLKLYLNLNINAQIVLFDRAFSGVSHKNLN